MDIEVMSTGELVQQNETLKRANEQLETELEVLRNEYKLALEDLNRMKDRVKRFEMENAELTAHLDVVQRDAKYTVGLVDGLKFAIRCNGVSGAEVKE